MKAIEQSYIWQKSEFRIFLQKAEKVWNEMQQAIEN